MDVPEQAMIDLQDIRVNPKNYKKHPATQIARIAASIKRFGQRKPIVVRGNGDLIAGEGTYYGIQLLAQEEPVKWGKIWAALAPDNWGEEEALGYLIADNETSLGYTDAMYGAITAGLQRIDAVDTPNRGVDNSLDAYTYGTIRQIILLFDVEEYAATLDKLLRIRQEQGLDTNADVVSFILDY